MADWISQDSAPRALEFIQEIEAEILLIANRPLMYQLRPEIGLGLRLSTVGRYVILFRVIGERVRIERVVFGGRDLVHLLRQET